MKSVMISIDRKYCYMIAEGTKTIDIRNTIPDIECPFKCYIYEPYDEDYDESYVDYDDEYDVYCYDNMGKVIGEFVCDFINNISVHPDIHLLLYYPETDMRSIIQAKMPLSELISYSNGNNVYGLHISDLKIYDNPKYLCEFNLDSTPKSWCYVESGG